MPQIKGVQFRLGCPDVSLLAVLGRIFGVKLEELLSGEIKTNTLLGRNMKKQKRYVCPAGWEPERNTDNFMGNSPAFLYNFLKKEEVVL